MIFIHQNQKEDETNKKETDIAYIFVRVMIVLAHGRRRRSNGNAWIDVERKKRGGKRVAGHEKINKIDNNEFFLLSSVP